MRRYIFLLLLAYTTHVFASPFKDIVKHQIQPGETLFRISLIYNTTVSDIIQANPGLNPKAIHTGMSIKIPKDTKIRDAARVEALLNGAPDPGPSEVQTPVKPTAVHVATPTPPVKHSPPGESEKAVANSAPANNHQVNTEPEEDENPFVAPHKVRTKSMAPQH